jgi:hypothetical protein
MLYLEKRTQPKRTPTFILYMFLQPGFFFLFKLFSLNSPFQVAGLFRFPGSGFPENGRKNNV